MPTRGMESSGDKPITGNNPSKFIEAYVSLTNRELQILNLSSHGDTNREIGIELHLSEATIKSYFKKILVKLGAKNKTHAVAIALKCDLI